MTGDVLGGELVVRTADLSRARPPRWAWQDRLVLGSLNLLLGNEGVGKGVIVAWLIAQLTRGTLPGDLQRKPVSVVILGDEDSFNDVWAPRLHAAGAELGRVLDVTRPDGGYVDIGQDREQLAGIVAQHGARLVYADALLDNLGAAVDDWRAKQVRDSLQPLRRLARDLDVAVLGALHPNKKAESFRQLVSGSSAFNAVSRSSLYLAEHPDDEDRRVLARGKGNLSPTPEAVELRIVGHRFTANGVEFNVPKAAGFAGSALTVDDLLDTSKRAERSQVAEAADLIAAALPCDGQWHPAKPLFAACAQEGIEERTVKRAKQRLGLEHRRASGFPAAVEWRWSTQDTASNRISVPTIPSVPSGTQDTGDTQDSAYARPDRSLLPTEDTQDTGDNANARPEQVLTSPNGHYPDADAELERIAAKWGHA